MKKALLALVLALVFVLSFTLCVSAAETNETETTTEGDIILGDVNGDGLITNADVLMIYRYIYNPELYPLPTLCYHEFGEWSVVREPDCVNEGLMTRSCIKCGAASGKAIEATGHTEIIDEAVAPTCTETGLTEGKHCSVCGEIFVAQTEIDSIGHDPSGIFIDTLATCTVDGSYHTECRRCKEVLSTGVLEKAGHNYSETVIPPTPAHEGYTSHVCSNCGDNYNDNFVPALASVGLEFTSKGDGTCHVVGIGTCTDTDVVIPSVSPYGDSVTSIGYSAFNRCTSLTSVVIPDSVTSISTSAFSNCTSLTSVTIGDSVTSIDNWAFQGCKSLKSVTIPDSVTSIGYRAFSDCTSLTSVVIPDSVTSIGDEAFRHCDSLTSVTIGDSVTSIGEGAFFLCNALTSVTIGDSVTSIGGGAFQECYKLTSVTIPDSVTSIGEYAFKNCHSLTSVIIGDSVTSIGDNAFQYCRSLTSVTIGDSVTSIGNYAFNGCTPLTSVTIPDRVTSIGDEAFYHCTSLTSVVIPDSVTNIGDDAFGDCKSLKDVYYTGTYEQWKKISIGSANSSLTSATRHYNYKAS